MWTNENRTRYDRSKLRYPSDLTDDEWKLIEPLIPPGKPGGGKRTVNLREVVNGLMYILSTGCQWRAIPKDLPPKSTIYVIAHPSPPADQAGAAACAARAARMAERALRPARRPVATMEQISA